MGTLILPTSGLVYLDANPIIYTVEKHPVFGPLLRPLWAAAQSHAIDVVSSELALLEALVLPIKNNDAALVADYELALEGADISLAPITRSILRHAATLRATIKVKTPDAIHLATAQALGCSLFITNDRSLHAFTGLSITILSDLLGP